MGQPVHCQKKNTAINWLAIRAGGPRVEAGVSHAKKRKKENAGPDIIKFGISSTRFRLRLCQIRGPSVNRGSVKSGNPRLPSGKKFLVRGQHHHGRFAPVPQPGQIFPTLMNAGAHSAFLLETILFGRTAKTTALESGTIEQKESGQPAVSANKLTEH